MEELNNHIPWQVTKYEEMAKTNDAVYFDVDDFEEVIDHYVIRGQYKEAFEVTSYGVALHPGSVPLMLKQAQLLATFNQENDALSLLASVERLEPTNYDIYLTRGAIYSQMQNYQKAIEEYNKAVAGADDPDYVYCNIAIEYENLGNFDKTLEYLDKALKVNPNNDLAIYEAAYCFDLLSLTDEGITFFQKLIDRNPYSTEAWFNLGVSYINAGLYEKALEALEYSIAIDHEHEHSWFHKGYALSLLDRHHEAIGAYEASMTEGDTDAMKLYYIGECHEKLEDYQKAITFYTRCSQVDPQMADAWVGIGVCEIEMGNTKKALKFLKHGLALDTENISYLCLLANTYFLLHEFELAKETYETALEKDPADEETWLEYAEALSGMKEFEHARKVLVNAMDLHPERNAILYAMAAILFLGEKPDQGVFCLEEAFAKDEEGLETLIKRFPKLKENNHFMDALENLRV